MGTIAQKLKQDLKITICVEIKDKVNEFSQNNELHDYILTILERLIFRTKNHFTILNKHERHVTNLKSYKDFVNPSLIIKGLVFRTVMLR